MRRAALLALALVLQAAPAAAQPPLRPGIGTDDPRVEVDGTAAPWRSLGRVQWGGMLCTGALVGPRTVLTAAHCLVGRGTQALVRPEAVTFLLGYHRGEAVARARGTRLVVGPGFSPAGPRPGPDWEDWALLTLDRPLGTPDRVLPLLRQVPPPRTPVMIAGYQQDRREVLLGDTGCRLLGLREVAPGRRLLLHDCAATRGASGAPLVLHDAERGGFVVAGLLVSVARDLALGAAVPAGALPPVE